MIPKYPHRNWQVGQTYLAKRTSHSGFLREGQEYELLTLSVDSRGNQRGQLRRLFDDTKARFSYALEKALVFPLGINETMTQIGLGPSTQARTMDIICATCRKTYGEHFNNDCPNGQENGFVPGHSAQEPDPNAWRKACPYDCYGKAAHTEWLYKQGALDYHKEQNRDQILFNALIKVEYKLLGPPIDHPTTGPTDLEAQ